MMDLNRCDIVGINLNPKKGDEIGKIRPCIVISNDDENHILDTIIVIPLSTQLIDDMLPYRLRLSKRDKLEKDSDILINHIRTISKKRVTSKIAKITSDEYKLIIKNLCENF
ncbi:MAG: type II toxin-antitoxin system PemK/MazF family toxin [Sulfurovum sp.]|nr:type II toxin-antitoxin system PemK/MazF family toxin [Sulfurovum sp.]